MVDPPAGGLLSSKLMTFYTYAIKNDRTNKIYIGHTKNLASRIKRHNQKLPSKKTSFTTKNKGPWKLVYREKFITRQEAVRREKQLKSYRGRVFIKNKIRAASSMVEQLPLKQ